MFVAPVENSSAKVADVANALLLVSPTEQKLAVQTDYGVSDPIVATIVNLDTNEVFTDMFIWNDPLIRAFKSILGLQTVGRIVKGTSKTPGHTPPWIFKSEVDLPASVAVATAYLSKATAGPDFAVHSTSVPVASAPAVAVAPAQTLPVAPATQSVELTPEVLALLDQLGAKPITQ